MVTIVTWWRHLKKICKNPYILKSNFPSEQKKIFQFCFDILVDNKIENEIKFRFLYKDKILRRYNAPKLTKLKKKFLALAPFENNDVILIFFYIERDFINLINTL